MYIERIKSDGLAHFSYLLGSLNEAVVIDPRRDIDQYLEICHDKGFKLKYVFETHRNEDYVIGSRELKKKVDNVRIYRGNDLPYRYGYELNDGQTLEFGDCKIKALHTPGHTLGSFSYIAYGETSGNKPQYAFVGDLLFAGDTGRTDFYGEQRRPEVSEKLYNSIHNKILPLGDNVILYPAHGSGSVCGSMIEEREPTTIGTEKVLNSQLSMSKEDFIEMKVKEHHEYPPYFKKMEEYNLGTAPYLDDRQFPLALTPKDVVELKKQGAQLLDTRRPPAYGGAHIKDSLSIWLNGIPSFGGWFLDYSQPIVLILDSAEEIHIAEQYLVRIGYDNIAGYLLKGMLSWYMNALPVEQVKLIQVQELKNIIDSGEDMQILDVRSLEERKGGYIPNTEHIYVGHIEEHLDAVSKDKPTILHCTVGYRANIAASVLLKHGYKDVGVVLGSSKAWQKAGYEFQDF